VIEIGSPPKLRLLGGRSLLVELVQRLENHWLVGMASIGGGGRVTRIPGATVLVNARASGAFANTIVLRGVTPELLPTTLELGNALLAGERRPPALLLSPLAGHAELLARALERAGWRQQVTQSVLMRSLPGSTLPEVGPIRVAPIQPDQLPVWSALLAEAYEVDPVAGEAIGKAWSSLYALPGEGAHVQFYLAELEGRYVGTGLRWRQGDTVGLYCGAVLPDARRRGVARALLVQRLADSAREGARLALLQTEVDSPMDHLCRTQVGFSQAYVRSFWALQAR
jgi:GNAT superfamily N-acetyltransferase